MPRAAVGVAVGQRAGERAMRRTTLLGRRGPIDRRPRQDVAELDAAVLERDETGRLRRDEILNGSRARPLERLQLAGVARGRNEQSTLRRFGQRLRATDEALRDAACDRDGRVDRQVGQPRRLRRELEQRERVACGRRVQTVDGVVPDERGSRFPIQPAEVQRPQLRPRPRRTHDPREPRPRRRSGPRRAGGSRTAGRRRVDPSSHWASSTNAATGAPSACAASRLSVAAPTANRSCAVAGRSASAPSSAARCGAGICSRAPSADEAARAGPRTGPAPPTRSRAHAGRACPPLRPARRRIEQRRLADPELADEDEHAASVQPGVGESGVEACRSGSRPSSMRRLYGDPWRLVRIDGPGGPPEAIRATAPYVRPQSTEGGARMATIEQAPLDMEKLKRSSSAPWTRSARP